MTIRKLSKPRKAAYAWELTLWGGDLQENCEFILKAFELNAEVNYTCNMGKATVKVYTDDLSAAIELDKLIW